MDCGVTPTYFQRNTYPSRRDLIRVIHDGIDTNRLHLNLMPLLVFRTDNSRNPMRLSLCAVALNRHAAFAIHEIIATVATTTAERPYFHCGFNRRYGKKPDVPFKDQMLSELSGH